MKLTPGLSFSENGNKVFLSDLSLKVVGGVDSKLVVFACTQSFGLYVQPLGTCTYLFRGC